MPNGAGSKLAAIERLQTVKGKRRHVVPVQIRTSYPPADTPGFVESLLALRKPLLNCALAEKSGLEIRMQLVRRRSHRELASRVSSLRLTWGSSKRGYVQESQCYRDRKVMQKDGTKMANQKSKKCAHIPCLCDVPNGEEYCGEACRNAGSEDVEIACQCSHPACPLTFQQFAPRSFREPGQLKT